MVGKKIDPKIRYSLWMMPRHTSSGNCQQLGTSQSDFVLFLNKTRLLRKMFQNCPFSVPTIMQTYQKYFLSHNEQFQTKLNTKLEH